MKITDRLTADDRRIYDHMPLVGRLMVHRDRREAQVMSMLAQQVMTDEAKHRIWAGLGLTVDEYRTLLND